MPLPRARESTTGEAVFGRDTLQAPSGMSGEASQPLVWWHNSISLCTWQLGMMISCVPDGAGSSYDDFRARNMTLLRNSPLPAGSPWQLRAPASRPELASGVLGGASPSHISLGGMAGPPMGGGLGQLQYQAAGPSRFGALRDGFPGPSPLVVTPSAFPSRTPHRCAHVLGAAVLPLRWPEQIVTILPGFCFNGSQICALCSASG